MKDYKFKVFGLIYLALMSCILFCTDSAYGRRVKESVIQRNFSLIEDRFSENIANKLLNLKLNGREIGREVLARGTLIGGLEPVLILRAVLEDNFENTLFGQEPNWDEIASEISFFFDMDIEQSKRQWINKEDVIGCMGYVYPNISKGTIVSVKSIFNYNYTHSVAECLAISLYDKDSGIIALVHLKPNLFFSEQEKVKLWMEVINDTLYRLKDRGADLGNLEARIIGGSVYILETGTYIFKTEEEKIAAVKRILKVYQVLISLNIPIVERDILRTERSNDLIVSAYDGLFYNVRP
ncbi:MAG: hypothetical protein P9L98_00700 [Candidatus Kaelpia imicola]|nr:hypothetical protein [Candidatus Kaelpia imicola]